MKRKFSLVIAVLALLLLLVQAAYSMSSPAYQVDWFTPATGSGGTASSTDFKIGITIGQTVSTNSTSPLYNIQMGYWPGAIPDLRTYLPIILRNP